MLLKQFEDSNLPGVSLSVGFCSARFDWASTEWGKANLDDLSGYVPPDLPPLHSIECRWETHWDWRACNSPEKSQLTNILPSRHVFIYEYGLN